MEAGEQIAIAELLENARVNWSNQEIVEEIIEAEFYDEEHGWTQELEDDYHNTDRDDLLAIFLPIYKRQLRQLDADDLANEYCREILNLEV